MKRYLSLLFAILVALPSMAQSGFGDYYDCRLAAHRKEGMPQNAVVWIGDSITEQGWWNMLSREKNMVNRGIGGDTTPGMLARLGEILEAQPSKIFLMAGVNDISSNRPVDEIVSNMHKMLLMVKEKAPGCVVYLQSVITANNDVLAYAYAGGKQHLTRELNERYKALCDEGLAVWVDLRPLLHNAKGELREELTKDGLHIHPEAYVIWVDYLKKMKYLRK